MFLEYYLEKTLVTELLEDFHLTIQILEAQIIGNLVLIIENKEGNILKIPFQKLA